jgi:DNA-binding response OmpR family regulator
MKNGVSQVQKLLIVEDDQNVQQLLRASLGYGFYQLHFASNGEDAIRLAQEVQPQVVVLDVMMPGKCSGFDVCRAIRSDSRLSDCFVIFLTAMGGDEDLQKGIEAGADAYMQKPFSPVKLIEAIETGLSGRSGI